MGRSINCVSESWRAKRHGQIAGHIVAHIAAVVVHSQAVPSGHERILVHRASHAVDEKAGVVIC